MFLFKMFYKPIKWLIYFMVILTLVMTVGVIAAMVAVPVGIAYAGYKYYKNKKGQTNVKEII